MKFKGLELSPGDHIAFEADSVPLPHIEAVVLKVADESLTVLSTHLAALGIRGTFKASEVGQIAVLHPAKVAVPRGSRERRFTPEQRVAVTVRGHKFAGNVIAAFDGLVVMRNAEGKFITGGALQFIPHQ
jgi:hypothetical protein